MKSNVTAVDDIQLRYLRTKFSRAIFRTETPTHQKLTVGEALPRN